MHKFLNTTTRSVIWFKKAAQSGDLQIKPPFQRNPVWSRRQQSSLIDTILKEYPIPEIYMQEVTDEEGNQKQVLVDGQQRIRAILEFCNGDFELNPEDSPDHADLAFDDLTADDKKRIFEYNFIVRLLPNIPDSELRVILLRLNKNTVELNAQELRHATYWGPFIKLMEEVSNNPFWEGSGIFSANDLRRMIDVEFISEITVAYLNGLQNKKKKLEEYYQLYEQSFEDESEVRTLFSRVLGEIEQIIPGIAKSRWKKKSDFYSLFLTLAEWTDQFPLPAEKRANVTSALSEFAQKVDGIIRGTITLPPDDTASVYTNNVERAASDLNPRAERNKILKLLLEPIVAASS